MLSQILPLEALKKLEELDHSKIKISLIICDLKMPHLRGSFRGESAASLAPQK